MKTKTFTYRAPAILLTAGLTLLTAVCGCTAASTGSGDAARIDAQSVRADNQADSHITSDANNGEAAQSLGETGQNNGPRT